MNQVWNIFRKDARHHWPETATSLALLATFAWLDIRSWNHPDNLAATSFFSLLSLRLLPGLVDALLPISWMFLIVRVVQGEPLVGDRQFWVTRPYDWRQLLAAKALFALAFINFPFFCTDVFLLARAGFHPTHYIVGLLWIQLMWIFFFFLATAALAAVTTSLPQLLLAALFVALYMVGMAAFSQVIPQTDFAGRADSWSAILLIATALAIIILQYSRRKTTLSRWLIAGLCAALTLTAVITPYMSSVTQAYPLSQGDVPVQLSLMSPEKNEGRYFGRGDVGISFPLKVSGIAADSFLKLDGMVVSLTGPSGARWSSGWQGQGQYVFPELSTLRINFDLKQKTYDQFKSGPVQVGLLLAFTLYHDQHKRQFVVPVGEFDLPEIGFCSSEMGYWNSLSCRAPLRRPGFLLVTSDAAGSTCHKKGEWPQPSSGFARGYVRGGDSEPAEMGISSVHRVNIYMSAVYGATVDSPGICPGTPIILSHPAAVKNGRVELQFNNLSFSEYAQTLGGDGASGFGIVLGH